jgi:hypothetical protein
VTDAAAPRPTDRLRGWLSAELMRRVVWVTDARRDARGETSSGPALVAVVGREHYTERRKSYPVRSRRDLRRVLALELADAPATLRTIGPLADERREVTFYQIDPGAVAQAGRALWLVPESLALARTLAPGEIADVERGGLRYFLAAGGASQRAGGAVQAPAIFALAVGADPEREPVRIGEPEALERLLAGLRRLAPAAWLELLNPATRPGVGVEWRPLAALAGAALFGYLCLASGYLAVTHSLRERELEALGPEVGALLEAQRDVDRLAAEQQGLSKVLANRAATHQVWRVAARAWAQGAEIAALTLVDGRLTLRGTAPVATTLLEALAAEPGVSDARFAAPTREARGREQFVITLALSPVSPDG